ELDRLKFEDTDADDLRTQKERLEVRIAEDREALEEFREKHGRIKAELDALAGISKELESLDEKKKKVVLTINEIPNQRTKAESKLHEAEKTLKNASFAAEAEASRLPEYEEAGKSLEGLREEEQVLHAKRDEANELLRERQEKERADKERQAQLQRLRDRLAALEKATDILPTVPCSGASEFAGCRFLVDAKQAEGQIPDLLKQIAELDSQVEGQTMEWGVQEAEIAVQEAAGAINTARTKLDYTASLAALAAPARLAIERIGDAQIALTKAQEEHFERVAEIDKRDHETNEELAGVRQKIHEFQTKIEFAGDSRKTLEAITAEGQILKTKTENDATALSDVIRAIAKAEEVAKRREHLDATIEEHGAKARKYGNSLADWKLLERAFGRDGIQALEIDAAGPDLSRLTNDLLHACFGERFQVTFVTQVPTRAGGMKEVFDVEVLDHERGREGSVDSLSGGEKTIISEAISLALAIYVAKHSDHRFETLFRDETAGALDPDNADRYVLMLRKARELAGAHQVIFIAQQPEVWGQADSVLWLEGGRAEVRE
ncbi:MAG: hypothetical protein DRJ65_00005, partial [Acidobacteria bacterium]